LSAVRETTVRPAPQQGLRVEAKLRTDASQ